MTPSELCIPGKRCDDTKVEVGQSSRVRDRGTGGLIGIFGVGDSRGPLTEFNNVVWRVHRSRHN